jgi:putative polyhydroxyalkanoate system protein
MRVTVPHRTTKEAAKKKLQTLAEQMLREHGHRIEDVDQRWEGDQLFVSMKARGFNVKGTVEVTDTDVIVDGKLPLIAKPFESKIKSTIEKEGQKVFSA